MGFTIAEVVVGLSVLAITIVTTTQAMLLNQRWADLARLRSAARAVLQRNIDSALSVTFSSTTTPAILATTTNGGSVYDDDAGGDNLVTITTQDDGTTPLVKGTLTRIVTVVTNPENAIIRQVTFSLSYTYRNKTYSMDMTTVRTADD